MRALLAINTAGLPRLIDVGSWFGLDWRVVTFAVALSLATGLLVGLMPALASTRVDLNSVIKSTSGRSGSGRGEARLRSAFVLVEVVLAVVLLIGAALLIRTSIALGMVEPGFRADNVLLLRTALAGPRYASTASVEQVVRAVRERLLAMPGVVEVGASCCVPTRFGSNLPFNIVGREPDQGQYTGGSDFATATPGYFGTFRIPVLRGRDFDDRDSGGAPGAVIVNQAFADRFWPNADALGERILIGSGIAILGGEPEREIVGIVADVRNRGIDDEPAPTMYMPQAQVSDVFNVFFVGSIPLTWSRAHRGRSSDPGERDREPSCAG